MTAIKSLRREKIRYRIRRTISGTATKPRLSVFRSNKQISVQLIDDVTATTLAFASSQEDSIVAQKGTKSETARLVGKLIAEKAVAAGITKVTFDRSGYLYHGRVQSLADGAREGGLQF